MIMSMFHRFARLSPSSFEELQLSTDGSPTRDLLDAQTNYLEQAIEYYTQALTVFTRETFPEQWATIQTNLAIAYRSRIHCDQADNLYRAIKHYQQALTVFTREASPADWVMTQNNLGNAYQSRIQGD